jgi:G3E family GTPase
MGSLALPKFGNHPLDIAVDQAVFYETRYTHPGMLPLDKQLKLHPTLFSGIESFSIKFHDPFDMLKLVDFMSQISLPSPRLRALNLVFRRKTKDTELLVLPSFMSLLQRADSDI